MSDPIHAAYLDGMAAGERAATERIKLLLANDADEAKRLWVENDGTRPIVEYWRGQANGLHHALKAIERGEHNE